MPRVTLIPGDGIGPDIVRAARRVIEATGVDISWDEAAAGESSFQATGNPLPETTLRSIHENRIALKGPTATPVGIGFRSINVALRQEFELYANVRPAHAFPGVDCLYPGLDIVVIRENTEGLYSSMEHWIGEDHTAVHKANILKKLSGLFLEVAKEMAGEFPDIEFEEKIVDAMAMQMVRDPHQFDVIVSTNLFGDILSDLAAGLVGGLGLAPGANIGTDGAIFEAVHGSAPDIAGKDLANPGSIILAGVMMLHHLGFHQEGKRIEHALATVLEEGTAVTPDIKPGSGVGTRSMTEAILARM
jgi:isocitrate dehydrogenase (NAD+)